MKKIILSILISFISSADQLKEPRPISNFTSSCIGKSEYSLPTSFEQSLQLAVKLNLIKQPNPLGAWTSRAYGISKWSEDVSLESHPHCSNIDVFLLSGNSKKKQGRVARVSKDLQELLNILATQNIDLEMFYFELASSLAYHESLTTADNSLSHKRFKQFKKYYNVKMTKPKGVKFYYDKYQDDKHSKRNIGLFQFSANRNGNIKSCLKSWNTLFKNIPSCKLELTSHRDAFKLLSQTDQLFNAFCGLNKIVQSIGVQVNTGVFKTNNRQRVHGDNFNNGKLLAPKERCISIFSDSPNTYNHFGTLGFTTDKNTRVIIEELLFKLKKNLFH